MACSEFLVHLRGFKKQARDSSIKHFSSGACVFYDVRARTCLTLKQLHVGSIGSSVRCVHEIVHFFYSFVIIVELVCKQCCWLFLCVHDVGSGY